MPELTEGAARLFPPSPGAARGPARATRGTAFYNPAMALNRDLSVLLAAAHAEGRRRGIDVADALAGAGARSLRLVLETGPGVVVHANDADPAAAAALRHAAKANDVAEGRLWTHAGNAHAFLASRRFDIVDIDPFGAPTAFLDAAVRATRHDGLVCLTATDTAALSGTHPRVCRRRYGAQHRLHAAPWRAEAGLRILAGAAVLAAGRLDRAATPVLSVSGGHWMRVVLHVRDGRGAADAAAGGLGWAWMDAAGLGHLTRRPQELPEAAAGPLWAGGLHEPATVAALQEAATGRPLQPATTVLLALLAEEAEAPAFWADPGRLQGRFGTPAPRRRHLMAALIEAGHAAARTHIDPQGVRTDADEENLRSAWASATKA